MSALLEFRRVSFAWKHRALLQEASFQLAPGETVALLGPNGAGKTTLLRLAAGMLQPDSGEVLLQGKRVTALNRRERAQKVALVPQRLQVPFAYTVQQIVEQARTPYTGLLGKLSTEDSEAVERAFILTDTAQFRDRVMQELSGGEQQRVKLALGLAQTPDLLLLDEPAQSLDIGWQHNLFATISSLRSEGVAILAAVHELHLVSKFFARSLLLAPGEPLQDARSDVMLASEELHAAFHREWTGPAQNIQEQN